MKKVYITAIGLICLLTSFSALAQTITTGPISGPFCVTADEGANVSVPFTTTGTFNPGNVYTAELSNAFGFFISPVTIGFINSSASSGTIPAYIPAGTFNGGGYRIRVVSSSPAVTGADNGSNLQVVSGFTAEVTTENITCNGMNNGEAEVDVTGGTAPFTYSWSGGAGTNDEITGLAAGTYTVTVTDDNGCMEQDNGVVTEPNVLSGTTSITQVNCYGATTGAINLTPTGGTPPYSYSWSGGQTSQDVSGLPAGTYYVGITDDNNCTASVSSTIVQPPALTSTIAVTNATCSSCTNGKLDLTPGGGTAPYFYTWSNSQTTQDISGLAVGTYSVIITDNKLCKYYDTAFVGDPSGIRNGTYSDYIRIYPNPSNGKEISVWHNANSKGNMAVLVTEVSGREIVRLTHLKPKGTNQYTFTIDVPPGIYILTITEDEQAVKTGRLMIVD